MADVKPRIMIQTKDGRKRTTTQWSNATWAVHRTYLRGGRVAKGRCWTLTHRASGHAIVRHIEWRDARALIAKLEAVVAQYDGLFTSGMCGCEDV